MQILSLMDAELEINCGTFGVPDDIDFNLFRFLFFFV
jgi:hypothetical protein